MSSICTARLGGQGALSGGAWKRPVRDCSSRPSTACEASFSGYLQSCAAAPPPLSRAVDAARRAPRRLAAAAGPPIGTPSPRTDSDAAAAAAAAAADGAPSSTSGGDGGDTDPVLLRLAAAASILAAGEQGAAVDDDGADVSVDASMDESSSAAASTASALSLAEDVVDVGADGLVTAVSLLRQRPADEVDAASQLSARLLRLLELLDRRPGGSGSGRAGGASASASAPSPSAQCSFWDDDDEWADIREGLLGAGVDASLDDEGDGDDDVAAPATATFDGEGRPRVLTRLPRFDRDTAEALATFLAERSDRRSAGGGDAAAAAAGGNLLGNVDADEAAWWETVEDAYDQLWQEANEQRRHQQE